MMPQPMRTAVCPHWGYLSIDDIYTGARKGQRRYVLSVLIGDVILVQPSAYGWRRSGQRYEPWRNSHTSRSVTYR